MITNRRLVLSGDQARIIDTERVDDLGSFRAIPSALGGGMVFVGERTVRFARSFTAPLTLVASAVEAPFELEVGVGRGRILVKFGDGAPSLHELPGGQKVALDPPGLSELFGSPPGMVAAIAAGALYISTAERAAWQRLPAKGATNLRFDGKGIVVDRARDSLRLGFDGKLGPLPNEPGMTVAMNLDAFEEPFPDFSRPPPEPTDAERLASAVARRMTTDLAIAIRDDDLLFLRSDSGKVSQTVKGALGGRQNCSLLRGGVPSFIGCNEQEMTLLRVDAPGLAPVFERSFRGISTNNFGKPGPDEPLVFAGLCDGSKEPGALCVRVAAEGWQQTSLPIARRNLLDPNFSPFVAASRDGAPYAFAWGEGTLIVIDGRRQIVRRIPRHGALNGIHWNSLAIESGVFRFLPSGKDHREAPGVIEIQADDSVHVEPLDGIVHAAGRQALKVTPDGKLHESLDAGRSFHEVTPPPGGLPDVSRGGLFCLETACIVGPWYRLGWGFREAR